MRTHKSYKLLLDVLPKGTLVLSFALFILTIVLAIGVIIFAPQTYIISDNGAAMSHVPQAYFNGSEAIIFKTNELSTYNFQIKYSLLLKTTPILKTYKKTGLFEVIVYGIEGDNRHEISDPNNKEHKRPLRCYNRIQDGFFCEPIELFRDKPLNYPMYEVHVRILNLEDEFHQKIFDDIIVAQYETMNPAYTRFEVILRFIYFGSSFILFFTFLILLARRVSPRFAKTEQKWVIVVLLSLLFFNFPFQSLDYRSYTWIFSIIEILSVSISCCLLVLFVMVMTHSVVVIPSKRRWYSFYLPKFVIVFLLWALIVVSLGWERFHQYKDPSYALTEVPFYGQLRILGAILLGVAIFMIAYYFARAVGAYFSRSISTSYSNRFFNFWLLTLCVMVALSIDLMTILLAKNVNNAAQFLAIFPIFNFYGLNLVIFFLPSAVQESDPHEKPVQEVGLFDIVENEPSDELEDALNPYASEDEDITIP